MTSMISRAHRNVPFSWKSMECVPVAENHLKHRTSVENGRIGEKGPRDRRTKISSCCMSVGVGSTQLYSFVCFPLYESLTLTRAEKRLTFVYMLTHDDTKNTPHFPNYDQTKYMQTHIGVGAINFGNNDLVSRS